MSKSSYTFTSHLHYTRSTYYGFVQNYIKRGLRGGESEKFHFNAAPSPSVVSASQLVRRVDMVSLKLQKRLAASVLKCGARKIWMDPNEVRLCQNLRCPEPVNSWWISQPLRLCRSGDVSANDHLHQQCLFLRAFCFAALRGCAMHRLSLFPRCRRQA